MIQSIMKDIEALGPVGTLVILAACTITVLVLFSKVIKGTLKLAVIAAMLICIAYFLNEAGIIHLKRP